MSPGELAQRPLYAGDQAVAGCLQAAVFDMAYIVGAVAAATVVAHRGKVRMFTPVLLGVLLAAAP